MKNCNYCGAPMDDTARFCPNCGKPAGDVISEGDTASVESACSAAEEDISSSQDASHSRFYTIVHHRLFLPVFAVCSACLIFIPCLVSFIVPAQVAPASTISESTPAALPTATPYVEDLSRYPMLEPADFLSTMVGKEDGIKCGVCGVVLSSEYESLVEKYCVSLTDGTNVVSAYYLPEAECIDEIKQLRKGDMVICYGLNRNNTYGSVYLNDCFGISDTGRNYFDEQQAEANDLSNYQYITLDDLCYEAMNKTDLYMSNNYYGHYIAVGGTVSDVYKTDEGEYCVYLSASSQGTYDYLKAYFLADTTYLDDITNLTAGTWVVCYGTLTGTDYGLTFEMAQCVCLEFSFANSTVEEYGSAEVGPALGFEMLDFGGGYIDNYGTDAITTFTQNFGLAYNSNWGAYTDANETIFTDGSSALSARGRNDFGACGVFLGTQLSDAYQIAQQYGCSVSEWEDGCIDFSADYHGYDIYYETDFDGDGTVSEIYIYKQN